jgi:hypothetical protein
MSEAQWLKATDPSRMYRHLGEQASLRKLRLFACACVRRFAHQLPDERSRRALEVGELYADGLADRPEMAEAERGARQALDEACAYANQVREARWAQAGCGPLDQPSIYEVTERQEPARPEAEAALAEAAYCLAATRWERRALRRAPWLVVTAAGLLAQGDTRVAERQERRRQCDLLREVFGNPFAPTPFDRRRLGGLGRGVRMLAQSIYEERAFDELPVLADALEEAGCNNSEILNHCRQQGEHLRGCWVLDLLLGRE